MKTVPTVEEFVATDIQMQARFSSKLITLDDTAALFVLLQSIVKTVQEEMKKQTGESVELLPEVSLRPGSIEVKIDVKIDSASPGLKSKLRAIFLSVLLSLGIGQNVVSKPENSGQAQPVSVNCDHVTDAANHALQTWEYYGKGFKATFESKCGDTTIKTTLDVPPNPRR